MLKALEHAGLTPIEAKIYVTLVELGPSLAGIISRKSGIHRRSIYDGMERLIQKGLVSYILKNNRKYFHAANPEKVLTLLQQQEEEIKKVLPEMLIKYNAQKEKQETAFYKGKDGLKTVFEDELSVGKEILVLGASTEATEILSYYFHWFDKRRVTKKIPMKLIYATENKVKYHTKHADIRYLPSEYQTPTATNIYGDRVAMIHWSKERPFAILIKDEDIAEGYRKYFELLWKIAKK